MVVFSFFSGVGMLDLGFQEAGFEIVFVNEFNSDFLKSYKFARRNRKYSEPRFGYHEGDINDFLDGSKAVIFQRYIESARRNNEKIGFIGGPPCPDFSVAGKNKGRDGDNGKLAKSYVDMICTYHPDFFLFENVKGLIKTERHREYYDELKQQLKQSGYGISDHLLNALCFGVPQDRERILLLGVKKDSDVAKKVIMVNDTFAFRWYGNSKIDVNEIKEKRWPTQQKFIPNTRRDFRYQVPKKLTVEYWFQRNKVYEHANSKDVFKVKAGKKKIRKIREGDVSRKSFKRLHRWRFSPTAAYGNNEVHLHPYKTRRLSVAEAMAIQSLPKWFELPTDVSLTAKFKTIGNGVPYLMAYKIAKNIKKYLL